MPVFVSVNVAVVMPLAVATIVKPPTVPFAVNVGLVTTPAMPTVQTETVRLVFVQPASVPNVALTPPAPGVIVNVTFPFSSGTLLGSLTVRPTALVKACSPLRSGCRPWACLP